MKIDESIWKLDLEKNVDFDSKKRLMSLTQFFNE